MNDTMGIGGTYKYLYSDFIVQEINLDKEVAYVNPKLRKI